MAEIEEFERSIQAAKKSIETRAALRLQRAAELFQQGMKEEEMRSKLRKLVAENKIDELEAMFEDARSVLGADDKDVLRAGRCLGEGKMKSELKGVVVCSRWW